MSKHRTMLQGQAGNYRVASELLLRGLNVFFPAVDSGVDLLVEGCVRVQVKSAHVTTSRRKDRADWPSASAPLAPSYGFRLTQTRFMGNRVLKPEARDFSKTCDFVVLWGIEENRFWIVPSALLTKRNSIVLGTSGEGRWVSADMESIRQLRLSGKTCDEIANELGMATMTVHRRLKGMFLDHSPNPLIKQVRECEGRWDSIIACLNTLQEATQQGATPQVAEGVAL